MDDLQAPVTPASADETPPRPTPSAEPPRPSRVEASRRSRRPLAILFSVVAVIVLAGIAYGGWMLWSWSNSRPLERVVMVGESMLEDGTTVAGLVAVIEPRAGALEVRALDTGEEAAIPGTSYDRLRDALSMGGASEVVAVVAGDDDKRTAWVVLDEAAWARVIDQAGGVQIDIPEETTVFTGEQLYRFAKGSRKLSGEEAVALVMGADELENTGAAAQIRVKTGEAVARALADNPELASEVLSAPGVDLSEEADGPILTFLSQAGR